MNKRLTLAAATLALALPLLQGCFTAVVGGAAVGVISAHDRRSTGTQADDETIEWRAAKSLPDHYKQGSHVNYVSYNRRLLITGEVGTEEAKAMAETEARKIEGVRDVFNEIGIGAASSLGSRSNDAYISSKVKARLVDSNQISANHIKVFTERAIVHLMGIVSEREAKVAVNVARTTAGVSKVVNVMEVVSDEEIKRLDSLVFGSRKTPAEAAPVETR